MEKQCYTAQGPMSNLSNMMEDSVKKKKNGSLFCTAEIEGT